MTALTPVALTAAFARLEGHDSTRGLFDVAPVFQTPERVYYPFDGYLPCYLVADGNEIVDVQDEAEDRVADRITKGGCRRFSDLDAWAAQVIADLTA